MSPASQAETVRIGDWRHLALGDVGSTNTECLQRAQAGDPGNLWITGERQLEGRGRRGRAWISEAGNLYASLLLIDPAPAEALASLPLVAAVAVHRAIEAVLPPDRADALKIKWPNDILLSGAKICGILLESETLPDGRRAVIVGQGINVAHAPPAGLYETTSLAAEGVFIAPDLLFARLLTAMAEELGVWNGGRGIGETLAAWRARAGGIGEPITVNLGERSLRGRFSTIDAGGRLVLHTEDGKDITVAAGDLFFGHGGRDDGRQDPEEK